MEEAKVRDATCQKLGLRHLFTQFYRPQAKSKARKQTLDELAQVVAEPRREAKEKGLDNMSKREVNAAVAAAREDLRKRAKQPVQ